MIKLARKYSYDKYGEGRAEIVTLRNSFHGRTVTTLKATGQDKFHQYFFPFTEGFAYAEANNMDSIRANVNEHTCAVMMELIQGEGGVMPLDQSFVQEVAAFCKERDLLLLVDEVQTGASAVPARCSASSSTASSRMLSRWQRDSAAVCRLALSWQTPPVMRFSAPAPMRQRLAARRCAVHPPMLCCPK